MIDKVVRDNKVAVLVSPGHGAGWSTWADHDIREKVMFDPLVVQWVEGGMQGDFVTSYYDNKYFYDGGAHSLVVQWVPIGSKFIITEYDGYETLVFIDEMDWIVA